MAYVLGFRTQLANASFSNYTSLGLAAGPNFSQPSPHSGHLQIRGRPRGRTVEQDEDDDVAGGDDDAPLGEVGLGGDVEA